jgi:hypothetical protein
MSLSAQSNPIGFEPLRPLNYFLPKRAHAERLPASIAPSREARADFAMIEEHLESIAGQLARVPTRAYLCRTLLLATASIWAVLAVLLIR